MTRTRYLKAECQHCGGHIEYPAEMAGMASQCPHCSQQTDLLLVRPPEMPALSRRTVVWTVGTLLMLVLGLGASVIALKRAERLVGESKARNARSRVQTPDSNAQTNTTPQASAEQNGFVVLPVELEKTAGSSLVYAVATVKNATERQRFGVRIEFDLLDAAGNKVGTAKDYQQVIEPGAEWHCRALVVESKAVAARLASVKEEQ